MIVRTRERFSLSVVIGIIALLSLQGRQPRSEVYRSGLEAEEVPYLCQILDEAGITNRPNRNGDGILVHGESVQSARYELARRNLPRKLGQPWPTEVDIDVLYKQRDQTERELKAVLLRYPELKKANAMLSYSCSCHYWLDPEHVCEQGIVIVEELDGAVLSEPQIQGALTLILLLDPALQLARVWRNGPEPQLTERKVYRAHEPLGH